MMPSSDYPDMDRLCDEILTAIELDELKLLDWGFVDVRSPLDETLPELLAALDGTAASLWQQAQEQWGIAPADILNNLQERKMLFKASLYGQYYYRSRFAETIRLLALLRQRFSLDDWQTASRLVSDFKIKLKRRTYPQRDVTLANVLDELRSRRANPLYLQAVAELLRHENGQEMRLAQFQKKAILQQYDALHTIEKAGLREQALVIGAGTGAGKTKAFYIPAMAEIASTISHDYYVRAMAIYPRIELLKDQFLEAFQEARKLDALLTAQKPRTIILGAYYGDTPTSAQTLLNGQGQQKWRFSKTHQGWECPFFSCPGVSHQHSPQHYPLFWLKKDAEQEARLHSGRHARLWCPSCHFEITSDQLLLTREQMLSTPPDILFTTTEMLNRRMSKANEHELFGCTLTTSPPPSLLLLDEIHTYEGLQGAQIAYLLRRWRCNRRLGRQAGTPLCCVGLSATLNEAELFFAKLTGIPKSRVQYVHPEEHDLEASGAEYNVMLKGDPVAATNLLSTSVQTVMLLARMLDAQQYEPSHGAFGTKIFAFTDKLDVINRWYHIELDAEQGQILSQYRDVPGTDALRARKTQAGQNWSTCKEIGHNLKQPLDIDRTSSQDRGVDSRARLVIATSTLEVGYNDATVGAVVQHKAPHSLASFLQRKGRAGRERAMRPWMVVVTSEYGRDRWAFQHAEHLFSPTLSTIDLPIENYYVRKMQATFALMDWLSLKLKASFSAQWVDVWKILSGSFAHYATQRQAICQLIRAILTDEVSRNELAFYLQRALDLHEQREIDALLWDEPRSLLFEVLPTLLRQLESNWRSMESDPPKTLADGVSAYPLPDFVTPNLFSDLQSFDIPISIPSTSSGSRATSQATRGEQQVRTEALALAQSLVEFAPGNVSKRYATSRSRKEAHWLAIPEALPTLQEGLLPIEQLKPSLICERFPRQFQLDGQAYQLYIPRAYALTQLPKGTNSSSNAQLLWKSHFAGQVFGSQFTDGVQGIEVLSLTRNSRWNQFLAEIHSYTHVHGSGVEVARMAVGVSAETRYDGKQEVRRLWLDFRSEAAQGPGGIGFINYVDALHIQLHPFDLERCLTLPQWPQLLKALRPEYFRHCLRSHELAHALKLSHFEREWLWLLEFAMLTSQAVEKQCSLAEAAEEVRQRRGELAEDMMKRIFQAQHAEDSGEEKVGRLHDKLRQLLARREIQQLLNDCAQALWQPVDEAFCAWLRQCYTSSLGATLFATFTRLVPDINPDDLHMDLDGDAIWISEAVPGGIGIIVKIVEQFKAYPHEFDLQMQDTLATCDRQFLSDQLQTIATYVAQNDQELASLFANLRQEAALATQKQTLDQLKQALEERGIAATREVVVALLAKFLRSNSAADSDKLIATLVDFWRREEERLQCVLDLQIVAVASLADQSVAAEVQTVLQRISEREDVESSQIVNILQSLLWFSCTTSCPDCIEEYHPFQKQAKPARPLLLALLQADEQSIIYGQEAWPARIRQELETTYRARLFCTQDDLASCQEQLLQLLVEPVDIGFQFFYPLVERITRTERMWTIEMRIRELAYA